MKMPVAETTINLEEIIVYFKEEIIDFLKDRVRIISLPDDDKINIERIKLFNETLTEKILEPIEKLAIHCAKFSIGYRQKNRE